MPSLIVRCRFDYEISGIVSDGQVAFSCGVFSHNQGTNSATRQAFADLETITANGSGHKEIIKELSESDWNTTPRSNYFVGMRIYSYTGKNSIVRLRNITFDVHVPQT